MEGHTAPKIYIAVLIVDPGLVLPRRSAIARHRFARRRTWQRRTQVVRHGQHCSKLHIYVHHGAPCASHLPQTSDAMYKLLTLLSGASVVVAQYPATITDHKQISLDDGRGVRFKEPQLCETTKGVKSYSGFLDVAEDKHFFFWFFESRRDPEADPVTLWLNGGPGADNMGGLFDEVGPCSLNEDLTTELREKSWNELSNLLFITQPVGVGFSYEHLVCCSMVTGLTAG